MSTSKAFENLDVSSLFKQVGLAFKFRANYLEEWDQVYQRLPFQPVSLLNSSIDYQLEYQQGVGTWLDLSLVILSDNKGVAIWPLSLSNHDGTVSLSSQGRHIIPPAFIGNCPNKTRKRIVAACLDFVDQIAKLCGIDSVKSRSSFVYEQQFDIWHLSAMERGAECEVRHGLYVDLSMNLEQIKSKIRKSYKPMINAGDREWKVDFIKSPGNYKIWEEFRLLHLSVAGRATRSKDSWSMQHEAIKNNEAFLITLRDVSGRLVGGGFFQCSKDEGLYAVGAYDRNLFHKPLGHLVQFRAIEELKRRNCQWYHVGERVYISDNPKPTDKEMSISSFKQGFASHVFPVFIRNHATIS